MCGRWYFLLLSLFSKVASREVWVNVKQGTLLGLQEATIFEGKRFCAFYKVPYAQPPIKKLRFKDPVAPKKWVGFWDGTQEFHGACAQPHIVHKHGQYGNEDCLYLNIFTPQILMKATDPLKPVIVWIHGYAFGSSFSHLHGADFLINHDVLFVTVTHRIGPFGFLKINETETHANMGLKDIVMALRWIKRNIRIFAGDSKKVTVMGSGSGATFLSWLLMTKARNLFSKMILQSGALFSASLFSRTNSFELDRLSKELLKHDVKKLTSASTQKIILASQKIYNSVDVINFQRPVVPFSPTIEKKSNKSLITMFPDDFFRHTPNFKFNKPMIVGYNSQESISEIIPFLHNPEYLKMFSGIFKFMVPFSDGCRYNYTSEIYKLVANKIQHKYFKEGISEKAVNEFLSYTSDLYKYPIFKFIKASLKFNSNKVFMYKFNFAGKFNAVKSTALAGARVPVKGAASGDEICYVLKCEPMWERYVHLKNGTSNNNKIMIRQLAEWWANFAKFGEPTPASRPAKYRWPAITLEDDSLMLIGNQSKLVHPLSDKKDCKFWDEIYENHYRSEVCDTTKHDEL
ncbi:juvenile hormone esterase-like [Leguminivora glycinivorella]|uniref:juvenile hormone esterase-like n=1 Tax=Leguminivora glycinivorella TaxID=1035111 RepID=UPI00200E833B|nr:juvenile hormone esterase-like [Leguminivora glycinivorella]